MSKNNKNKSKQRIPVYCTEWDLKHPTVLRLAYASGIIPKEDYQDMIGKDTLDISLTDEWVVQILESYFGFDGGVFDLDVIQGKQTTLISKEIKDGGDRYSGLERTDDTWVNTGLASREAKDINLYGSVLTL